jgi:tetratricopeptide (TPR) repeat protein
MKKPQKTRPTTPGGPAPVPQQQPNAEANKPVKPNVHDATVSPLLLVVPAVMLMMYLYLWFVPGPVVMDPWWEAADLMESASNMTNAAQQLATLEKAGSELKRLSAQHPYHARLHYFLSVYYLNIEQIDSAIAEAKEAVRLGSGGIVNAVDGAARNLLVDATLKKAQPLIDKRDFNAAYQVLHDSYTLAPGHKTLLVTLGNTCLEKNDDDCAGQYFEEALKVDPQNAEIYMVLGKIAKSQGRIPKAIEYLEKAIALNPKLSEAQNSLAILKSAAHGGN